MVELVLTEALPDPGVTLPHAAGRAVLSLAAPAPLLMVAPFAGQRAAVDAVLAAETGAGLPDEGRSNDLISWFAAGQWLVTGAPSWGRLGARLAGKAATVDLSDGWVALHLAGDDARDVLARACPLDLRDDAFPPGRVARTELYHMPGWIRRDPDGYRVMVMRSTLRWAVEHLVLTVDMVAARRVL